MKVKELISQLQQLPQDLEVKGMDPGCGCCSSGDLVDVTVKVKEATKWKWGVDGQAGHYEVLGEYVDVELS